MADGEGGEGGEVDAMAVDIASTAHVGTLHQLTLVRINETTTKSVKLLFVIVNSGVGVVH